MEWSWPNCKVISWNLPVGTEKIENDVRLNYINF
jgi:hypothetical protein